MGLMFTRLARNFIKNGYFPTDDETLTRIQRALIPGEHHVRLLDPCCGEGAALADLAQGLLERVPEPPLIETYGVEFDQERAWHAKTIVQRVIHADIHDVVVKPRSISLLFLNPPYGFGLKDNTNSREVDGEADRAERLERTFLKKTAPLLAPGGVLVYIIRTTPWTMRSAPTWRAISPICGFTWHLSSSFSSVSSSAPKCGLVTHAKTSWTCSRRHRPGS